jgi:DnaD/phage-associated family protein
MRQRWQRRWIKIYPIECLEGSIRYQLEADERGVWYDLLNFAAVCVEPGTICDRDNRPFPHSFIANRLNIPLELLERTLKKCCEEGRIDENDNGIHITNWKVYQSEYERQKPYRGKKGLNEANIEGDANLKAITKVYEENIGIITPVVGEDLKDISERYSAEWFKDAVSEAVKANVRKLKYVEAILERWAVEGRGTPKSKDKGKKGSRKGRYGHLIHG